MAKRRWEMEWGRETKCAGIVFFYMDNRDESGLKNAFPCQSDCIVDKRREGDDIIHCSQLKVRLIKGDFYGRLNSHSGALVIHANVSCQPQLSAACHVMQTVLRPLQISTQTKKTSRRLSATVSIDWQRYRRQERRKKTGKKLTIHFNVYERDRYSPHNCTNTMCQLAGSDQKKECEESLKICVNSFNVLVNIFIVSCLNI